MKRYRKFDSVAQYVKLYDELIKTSRLEKEFWEDDACISNFGLDENNQLVKTDQVRVVYAWCPPPMRPGIREVLAPAREVNHWNHRMNKLNFKLFIYVYGAAIFVKLMEFFIRFTNR